MKFKIFTYCMIFNALLLSTGHAVTGKRFKASIKPFSEKLDYARDQNFIYSTSGSGQIPYQGWKIHVGLNAKNYYIVLNLVTKYLTEKGVFFKIIKPQSLYRLNMYSSSAYKVFTIYPKNKEDAVKISKKLDKRLSEVGGKFHTPKGELLIGLSGALSARYGVFGNPWNSYNGAYVGPNKLIPVDLESGNNISAVEINQFRINNKMVTDYRGNTPVKNWSKVYAPDFITENPFIGLKTKTEKVKLLNSNCDSDLSLSPGEKLFNDFQSESGQEKLKSESL